MHLYWCVSIQASSFGLYSCGKRIAFPKLFCVIPGYNSHTHYLLMQLIVTSCMTWSLPPVSSSCSLPHTPVQARLDRGWEHKVLQSLENAVNCWVACLFLQHIHCLKLLRFNREAQQYFMIFSIITALPLRTLRKCPWGHCISRKTRRNTPHLAALTGMNTIMKSWSNISTDLAKKNHSIEF